MQKNVLSSLRSDKCDRCYECDKCLQRRGFQHFYALIALIALIASSQAGCARLLNSYDVAPDGLQRAEHEFRGYLSSGRPDSALLYLNNTKKKNAFPKDDLL